MHKIGTKMHDNSNISVAMLYLLLKNIISSAGLINLFKIIVSNNAHILNNDNVLTLNEYLSMLYLNGGVLYGNN